MGKGNRVENFFFDVSLAVILNLPPQGVPAHSGKGKGDKLVTPVEIQWIPLVLFVSTLWCVMAQGRGGKGSGEGVMVQNEG